MTEYYNLLNNPPNGYQIVSIGVLFTIIGFFILKVTKRNPNSTRKPLSERYSFINPPPPRPFMIAWTGFAVIMTIVSSFTIISDYIKKRNIINNHQYSIVEGIVEDFYPMKYSGKENESFSVNGISFEYSDYNLINGFNNTKSHGGPIDEGKYVKIHYFKGKILQLWISE